MDKGRKSRGVRVTLPIKQKLVTLEELVALLYDVRHKQRMIGYIKGVPNLSSIRLGFSSTKILNRLIRLTSQWDRKL